MCIRDKRYLQLSWCVRLVQGNTFTIVLTAASSQGWGGVNDGKEDYKIKKEKGKKNKQ